MKIRFSIKLKLALALALYTTLALGALAGMVLARSREALVAETTHRGILIGQNLASYSAPALLVKDLLTAAGLASDAMKNEGMAYAVLADEKGRVVADASLRAESIGRPYTPASGEAKEAAGLPPGARLSLGLDASGAPLLHFAFPVLKSGVAVGHAYVGLSQSKIQQIVGTLTRQVAWLATGFLVLGLLGALGLASLIVAPVKRLSAGALAIGQGDLQTRIAVGSADEIGMLAQSFNDMAANLKTAQDELLKKGLLEHGLAIAHEIQGRLLPRALPAVPGYQMVGHYQPAEEVGGDYYDALALEGGRIGLVAADVSGKGVPGCLGMAMTRAEFRVHAFGGLDGPEVLKRTNQGVFPDFGGKLFVSLYYAILDPATGRLRCANAGHNPAYVVSSAGAVREARPAGPALGLFPPKMYKAEEMELKLGPGELFVLYTDGVTEAKDQAGEDYGDERFKALLAASPGMDPGELKDKILKDVAQHASGAPQHDDITLLLLKRER